MFDCISSFVTDSFTLFGTPAASVISNICNRLPYALTFHLKRCPAFELTLLRAAVHAPLRRRPVRSAGVRSPGRPRCQSVAVSPPDGGYTSSALRRCSPSAPYPIAERRGGRCCTSSRPPGKQASEADYDQTHREPFGVC